MESQSFYNAIVAGFFLIAGVVSLVFRRGAIEFYYETVGNFPAGLHIWFSKSTLLAIHTVMASLITLGAFGALLLIILQ